MFLAYIACWHRTASRLLLALLLLVVTLLQGMTMCLCLADDSPVTACHTEAATSQTALEIEPHCDHLEVPELLPLKYGTNQIEELLLLLAALPASPARALQSALAGSPLPNRTAQPADTIAWQLYFIGCSTQLRC